MQNIYLIRHFKPSCAPKSLIGHSDIGLDNSQSQANTKRVALVKQHIGVAREKVSIYSSDLLRAYETAQLCFGNAQIRRDQNLREINFGDFELNTWEQIERDHCKFFNEYMENWQNMPFPNGESYAELEARCRVFCEQLPKETDIVIVSHAGTTRALLKILGGLPSAQSFATEIKYGSIIKLECSQNSNQPKVVWHK